MELDHFPGKINMQSNNDVEKILYKRTSIPNIYDVGGLNAHCKHKHTHTITPNHSNQSHKSSPVRHYCMQIERAQLRNITRNSCERTLFVHKNIERIGFACTQASFQPPPALIPSIHMGLPVLHNFGHWIWSPFGFRGISWPMTSNVLGPTKCACFLHCLLNALLHIVSWRFPFLSSATAIWLHWQNTF